MNATLLLLLAFAAFLLAFNTYGRLIRDRIFPLRPSAETPAHKYKDGMDYVPTNKAVLFGHHFATIAGLGPIVGPAIAVIWGWLPAVLWVVFGTIFMGAVHDFSSLVISLRHEGRSIGEITEDVIGYRAKLLFQLIIFFLLALAMGVFALITAKLFKLYPESVIPVISLVVIAMLTGGLVYKTSFGLVPSTMISVFLMFFMIWVGTKVPVTNISQDTWVYILLVYAFTASVLPVWLLLQPRDYLNSFALYAGIIGMTLGLFIYRPAVVAPSINSGVSDLPGLFPFLFITIACGAISGFHNLVSSGTTARQISNEKDSLLIGYGGMLTEGLLAVLVIIACTAGVATTAEWRTLYPSWAGTGLEPSLRAVIDGGGLFISKTGISLGFAKTFIAVMSVGFAITTLDSATRLLRYNVESMGDTFRLPALRNRYAASGIAIIAIGYFALIKIGGKPSGVVLWQLFGTTNQLLAGLGLLTVTVWLHRTHKPVMITLLPMLFMFFMTGWAIIVKIYEFSGLADPSGRSIPLLLMGTAILIMALWLFAEGVTVYMKYRRSKSLITVEVPE